MIAWNATYHHPYISEINFYSQSLRTRYFSEMLQVFVLFTLASRRFLPYHVFSKSLSGIYYLLKCFIHILTISKETKIMETQL